MNSQRTQLYLSPFKLLRYTLLCQLHHFQAKPPLPDFVFNTYIYIYIYLFIYLTLLFSECPEFFRGRNVRLNTLSPSVEVQNEWPYRHISTSASFVCTEKLHLNYILVHCICLFPVAQQPPVGPRPPHYRGFTITLRHTPHSVWLLWTSDRPDAETSTWQHTPLTRDRHPCPRQDSNPQSQYANGRTPTP
jgi:hypothetical protein